MDGSAATSRDRRLSTDYELTIFGPGERDAFEATFAEDGRPVDPVTHARRRWWAFDNPAGGAFCVMRAGSTIAATSYLGGKRIVIDGVEHAGFEIGETATDPAHQRRGLFSKLVNASRAHAAELGRPIIYGTPNSQSTPGYAKLNFSISVSDKSWLFLVPNLRFAVPVPWPAGRVQAIDFGTYSTTTSGFARLNRGYNAYLAWRLRNAPMAYRFFAAEIGGATWHVAMRPGMLGRYPTLICSEIFRNGAKAEINEAAAVARQVARAHIAPRSYAAIQIHGALPEAMSATALKLRGIVPHRVLPICAVGTDADAASWFDRFQLSDCDIG